MNNKKENLTRLQQFYLEETQQSIDRANAYDSFPTGLLSDGNHTFDELYDFRKMYNALLFNEWYMQWKLVNGKKTVPFQVHKSWKHNDGEYCFGREKEWFIVSAMLPTGLISNHYKAEDWDLFKVPEVEKALFEYDGHDGKDVLERLKGLIS